MAVIVAEQSRAYRNRPVLVVANLADLHGPVTGPANLPIWLFWSGGSAEDSRFNLDDPVSRATLYRTVVREARHPADLTDFLDGDTLVGMWPDLSWRLPREVQAAWEDQHPVLRAAGQRRSDVLRPAS
jgi:hypothetical protein